MRPFLLLISFLALSVCAALSQVNTGELRVKVTDSTGAGLQASVTILSQGNQYRAAL